MPRGSMTARDRKEDSPVPADEDENDDENCLEQSEEK